MWKSREDKLPPPSYFSMIVAYLQKAHENAQISREMMETLRPHFIEAWRNGKSAEAAAQTTCSCQQGQVVPSPVVGVRIAKGSVRPPKDAQRGEVFGAEALRPSATVERLGRRLEKLAHEQAKQEQVTARWARRAQTARKASTQREATHKQVAASTQHAVLLAEARRIEAEIKRLQGELSRPMRLPNIPPVALPAGSPAAPKTAPSTPVADTPASPRPARKKALPAKPVPAAADVPMPAKVPSPEGDAMLRAVQGLLPGLAEQLAAEMAKERTAK